MAAGVRTMRAAGATTLGGDLTDDFVAALAAAGARSFNFNEWAWTTQEFL